MKLFILFGAFLLITAEALQCWECENQRSNEQCQLNGKLKTCADNEEACENEIRTDDRGMRITKRCKQALACHNNYIQNPRAAWSPSQCNPNQPHTVCRCCCSYDECNAPALFCLEQSGSPECNTIGTPVNGRRDCVFTEKINEVGSVCSFQCNSGYELTGPDVSTCVLNDVTNEARFDNPVPRCTSTECQGQTPPPNGFVACTDDSDIGSICSFGCASGYYLDGNEQTTCTSSNTWSNPSPTCIRVTCPQLSSPTGSYSCSDEYFLGSTCRLLCNAGFGLLNGASDADCLPGARDGVWSFIPQCRAITCNPQHTEPANGIVSCSNNNNFFSVCDFGCDQGFTLSGQDRSTCLGDRSNSVGNWNSAAPTCESVVCEPPHSAPINGDLLCTNANNHLSECGFVCNQGFHLVGDSSSTCIENPSTFTVSWSSPAPTCEPITCQPPLQEPDNGISTCTDTNNWFSICTFVCADGYDLIGSQTSTCREGEGVNGAWSSPTPICRERVRCLNLEIEHGTVVCTDDNHLNSTCYFSCEPSYILMGGVESKCVDNNSGGLVGVWSEQLPTCQPMTCEPPHQNPEFGTVNCSDDNMIASFCLFTCSPAYQLQGPATSTCLVDITAPTMGRWDNLPPICIPRTCPDQGSLSRGDISCSDGNLFNSVCSFTCDEADHTLFPNVSENVCQLSETWDLPKPCCARQCPPYAVMDAVLILDSSSSIGADNWETIMYFVINILTNFTIGPDATQFAVFRYNRLVDDTTQILLNEFDNTDDLLAKYDLIPYDGSGTWTGQALRHARDVILLPENGNRPDVKDIVLVITDGRSQDEVAAVSQQLRDDGVLTYVIGIETPGGLDLDQLNSIAGNPDNLMITEGGFGGLNDELNNKISGQICGDPCAQE